MTKSRHGDEWNLRQSKLRLRIESVAPFLDCIPKRLRALNPEKVDKLAESMAEIGLLNPITVWSSSEGDYEVVAGAHRVAAAVKLDWDFIDAVFVDDWSEVDRQLWEIDENLIRAELSPTEMAEHLARREKLWGQRNSGQSLPSIKGPGQPKGFAADTAEKTGMSKRAINLATSRAEAIPSDIRAIIKGTRLDKGSYLDKLKMLQPAEQRSIVKEHIKELKKSARVRGALRKLDFSGIDGPPADPLQAVKREFRELMPEHRTAFIAWLEEQGHLDSLTSA